MLFDNIDTTVTLFWTMDRICICIFSFFFGVAIVLFLCFSTVIGKLKDYQKVYLLPTQKECVFGLG